MWRPVRHVRRMHGAPPPAPVGPAWWCMRAVARACAAARKAWSYGGGRSVPAEAETAGDGLRGPVRRRRGAVAGGQPSNRVSGLSSEAGALERSCSLGPASRRLRRGLVADAGPDGAAEQATADDAGVPTPHVAAEPPPVHIQPQSKVQMDLLCTEICAWGALNSSAADELQHGLHGYTYTTNSPIPYLRGGARAVCCVLCAVTLLGAVQPRRCSRPTRAFARLDGLRAAAVSLGHGPGRGGGVRPWRTEEEKKEKEAAPCAAGQGVVLLFPTAAVRTRPGMQVKTTRAMKLFANQNTYGKEILHYQDPRFRDFMPRMLEYGYYDSAGQVCSHRARSELHLLRYPCRG